MRTFKIIILLLSSILFLSSCSTDKDPLIVSVPQDLKVSASISNLQYYTRSAINGTAFSEGDVIGIYLNNADGQAYAEKTTNLPVTYTGGIWTLNPVSLTEKEAIVYGYYPYSVSTTDMKMNADIASQADYLYAEPVSELYNKNANADLIFKHALTRITFKIKKKEANVYGLLLKSVSISNEENSTSIAEFASIDIKTGDVTPTKNADAIVTIASEDSIIESSVVDVDMLLLPFNTSKTGRVKVTFAINDVKYEAELPDQSFIAGNRYIYPVTTTVKGINPDDDPSKEPVVLTIGSVIITDWQDVDMSEITEFTDVTSAETLTENDLGTSAKWSNRNMGSYTSTGCGSYYAWGEASLKSTYTMDNYVYQTSGTYKPLVDNLSGTIYDVAHKAWSNGWHIPTKEEWQALIDGCTWSWTSVDGVYGMKATGNGNSIFLPAAGYATDKLNGNGTTGYYMTANKYNDSQEYVVTFNSSSTKPTISTASIYRYMGVSIRAVK